MNDAHSQLLLQTTKQDLDNFPENLVSQSSSWYKYNTLYSPNLSAIQPVYSQSLWYLDYSVYAQQLWIKQILRGITALSQR